MGITRADGFVVGVISDTHDHLYPEVKKRLVGVDHIIHAGDVCSGIVLSDLRAIAPLTVVRGNCDLGAWAMDVPVQTQVELEGVSILVGHMVGPLRLAASMAATAGSGETDEDGGFGPPDVVVFGHSHQALIKREDGILYLNPGSAGPRRFGRPRTMAYLRIAPSPSGATEAGSQAGASPAERVSADIVVLDRQ